MKLGEDNMKMRRGWSRRNVIGLAGGATAMLAMPSIRGAQSAPADTIRIAAPLELSGPAAGFGSVYYNAAKMTVDEINKAGGIKSLGGAMLEIIAEDTRSDLQRTLEVIDKLADRRNVIASIGPSASATAVPASLKYEQLQISYITPALVDDAITDSGRKYFFRLTARMNAYVEGVVDFVKGVEQETGIKHKKIGLVSIDVEPGTIATRRFEQLSRENNWDYVLETYDFRTTRDFAPMISRLRAAGVDLVLGLQYPLDAVLFAKAAQQLDFNPIAFVWAIGGQYLNSFVSSGGKAAEFVIDNSFTAPADTSPATKELSELHMRLFKEPLTGYAGCAPAAIMVIADAMERAAKIDRNAVRDAIAKTDIQVGGAYMTIPGGVKFNNKGDNVNAKGAVIQIVGGKQHMVWPPSPTTTKPTWPRPPWAKI
jgi:branched-chain amino acid transport system substrate-binding protein